MGNNFSHKFEISGEKLILPIKRDSRGYNTFWNYKRSKTYLFKLAPYPFGNQHLKIITNDHHFDISSFFLRSTSKILNVKYQISRLLTHFFKNQKVIPKRIQNRYFNGLRRKFLERIKMIDNRSSSNNNTHRNNKTNTFFRWSYKDIDLFLAFIQHVHSTTPLEISVNILHRLL